MAARADDKTADTGEELKGVLVLASGELVRVPAEGVAVSTHHYSGELKSLVPVRSFFVLA